MARAARPLDTDDPFPELAFETVAHGQLVLPIALSGRWGLVLVYRAHW